MNHLSCYNTRFAEQQLDNYLRDPASVAPAWRKWFEQMNGDVSARVASHPPTARRSVFNPASASAMTPGQHLASARMQDRVDQLITAFRVRGHLAAQLDPLGMARPSPPELSYEAYGLTKQDLGRRCSTLSGGAADTRTVAEVIERMRSVYCRHLGVQFMHIDEPAVRQWFLDRLEGGQKRGELSRDKQLRILTRLTDAVIFEEFVRKKYIGAKTFSLEGAESLIPLLDLALEHAGDEGIEEVVFGMAHRGRLNVLANIIGKRPMEIFWEFNDPHPEFHRGSGDVKYHMGHSGTWTTDAGKKIHLSLCFNPSHLEYVNPVALGRMRAKQDRIGDHDRKQGMVILIHGDAGFAGEGIVQETLNLSQLPGYATGGTLHVIVNNQLGFTTSPGEGSSTIYPSDVARMLQIPIFHVNGEQPEAVAQAIELAMDYRTEFHRDAVIDLFCYRRWGHNEGDEPSFTQPLMYQAIEHRDSVRTGYLEHLLELDGVSREEADEIAEQRQQELGKQFKQAQEEEYEPTNNWLSSIWKGYLGGQRAEDDDPETGVARDTLVTLLQNLTRTPTGFHLHKKLKRIVERRQKMAEGNAALDWSTAEALAIATLAVEGHPVRISGQDTARGTFSQRHAVLHDVDDGGTYAIFQHLADDQAAVDVINSPLSEAGVLGFEYGYSLDYPEALVAWEAQYGDFANAAQVIQDQFLASAEDKWHRLSGLVLLLPHAFEGSGPEHSSARLERFLNLAAEDNLQIVYPTTPAQYYHVLRRQVKQRWRKPLVVLTPKSLLRHSQVVSPLEELTAGRFQRVIPDLPDSEMQRILLCSGKVYYDLLEYREANDHDDVAIVRVEQLYPRCENELQAALEPFSGEVPVVWVQEEPHNMGAWRFLHFHYCDEIYGHPFRVVSRAESASPATGSKASHKLEQQELVSQAFEEA